MKDPLTEILTEHAMAIKSINDKLDKMPTKDEMMLANELLVKKVLGECDERFAKKDKVAILEKMTYAMWGVLGSIATWYLYTQL